MARFRGLVQDLPPPPPLAERFCLLPQVEYIPRLLFTPALTVSVFAVIQLIFRRYRPAVVRHVTHQRDKDGTQAHAN
jgi:hypothetical protein